MGPRSHTWATAGGGTRSGVPGATGGAGALAILILILLVRPQGILGRAERVG